MKQYGDWFAPRRYGYGSGLPIAWQGWAVLGVFFTVIFGAVALASSATTPLASVCGLTVVPLATALFLVVCSRTTRGGWRWRWGGQDD